MSCHEALKRMWREDQGFLTFEWVLLLTLLAIGIVGGLTAARDATIDELGDVAEAVVSFDQSYSLAAFSTDCNGQGPQVNAPGFSFVDQKATVNRCGRGTFPPNP